MDRREACDESASCANVSSKVEGYALIAHIRCPVVNPDDLKGERAVTPA